MNPSALNCRVTVEAKSITKGASGGQIETWAPLVAMPVWAAINHLGGTEKRATAAGGGEVAEARTEITLRYRAGITANMRVVHGSTYYNIKHVNNFYERNERLILTCDTGVNNG